MIFVTLGEQAQGDRKSGTGRKVASTPWEQSLCEESVLLDLQKHYYHVVQANGFCAPWADGKSLYFYIQLDCSLNLVLSMKATINVPQETYL